MVTTTPSCDGGVWIIAVGKRLKYQGAEIAIGALATGRVGEGWLVETRRWTLFAWGFLTVGIGLGAWWSYEVLGWGGWWAWDPVENASFMPWLTATAFMHSGMVQERRGLLRVWNMSLIVATFLLTILGTFLTRSGIISSVHAFSEGPIGMYFLAFIAVVLLFSLILLTGRSSELRSDGHLDNMVSRETVFLVNNLLLTAFTFTVLLGTMFPLVAEALRGEKVSVGAPFFNQMTIPICVMLLFLVGVGPMLPWKVANLDEFKRKTKIPSIALVLTLAIALGLGLRNVWGLIAFSFAAWAAAANLQEFAEGTAARRRAGAGGWLKSLLGLVRANPRRYGGYVAHLGLILSAIGMTGSSVLQSDIVSTVSPGEAIELRGYTVRFDDIKGINEPHRFVVLANLTVLIEGREVGRMDPRLNYYRSRGEEAITTPSVRSRAHQDLYVNLLAFGDDGSTATLHVIVEPLVVWIWIGSFVVAFGALISIVGGRRRAPPPTVVRRPPPLVAQEA